MKTAHDQAREHGGCGEIINVDAFCDGDAVPSTAGLCDSPAKHRQHVTELSTAEAAVVQRFEAAADAEESLRVRVASAMHVARCEARCDLGPTDGQLVMADAAIAVMRGVAP